MSLLQLRARAICTFGLWETPSKSGRRHRTMGRRAACRTRTGKDALQQNRSADATRVSAGCKGTAICGVFDFASRKHRSHRERQRAGVGSYQKIYLHSGHHASYFHDAKPINLKLIFRSSDERVLGRPLAQPTLTNAST